MNVNLKKMLEDIEYAKNHSFFFVNDKNNKVVEDFKYLLKDSIDYSNILSKSSEKRKRARIEQGAEIHKNLNDVLFLLESLYPKDTAYVDEIITESFRAELYKLKEGIFSFINVLNKEYID